MYAVIETGGKQHKVEKGMILSVDLLKDDVGKKITFDNVLLYVDGDKVEVGQPYLSNVKVTAEVKDTVKGEKISILRFRRRKHSMIILCFLRLKRRIEIFSPLTVSFTSAVTLTLDK